MAKKRKIILVDSNNIAYRAFYALPQTIITSTGTITNAVYGFTAMILKLAEEQRPDEIICAFDSKWPTFRHELFEEYKARRKKMPEELSGQILLIREVMEALNISSLEISGFEADDIIATLAKKALDLFDEIIILSGDKDILQLVSEKVKVISMKKGITDTILYNTDGVIERFGVEPSKIKDLLALMGDSSDNIPGVQGIGPKTALELVSRFGSIESIYENLGNIKNEKLRNLLFSNIDTANKSKTLTELNDNLEIDIEKITGKAFKDFEYNKVESIFNSLEFNTLKKRVRDIAAIYGNFSVKTGSSNGAQSAAVKETDKEAAGPVKNIVEGSTAQIERLKGKNILYLSAHAVRKDTLQPVEGNSERHEDTEDYIIFWDGEDYFLVFDSRTLLQHETAKELSGITGNPSLQLSGFDLKHICKLFQKYGIELDASLIDLKILYLLLNPSKPDVAFDELYEAVTSDTAENIKSQCVLNIIGYENPGDKKAAAEAGKKQKDEQAIEIQPVNATKPGPSTDQMFFSFDDKKQESQAKLPGIKEFAEKNKTAFYRLAALPFIKQALESDIRKEGLENLYHQIEGPLIKVLALIEFKGVYIDLPYLEKLIKQYEQDIKDLTNDIFGLCDSQFNINSTRQLAEILYKKLNLAATKKTKTGFSTDAATLYSIYDSHPVIAKILDYREKVKLKNTYLDVLPTLVDPADGRVHTTYNQLGTTTGRISSNNPNLQNIPVRTDLGRQIRKAFVPGKGYDTLLSADYSQIELRILAHLSGDSDLIEAFNSGQDIHTRTASEIFGVKYEDIDENLRRKAKAINFGIIYGMTEFGLKSRLSISEDEAREYIRLYFARYPGVKQYMNQLIGSAYSTGYTTTMFGRKRYIKELASTNANLRSLGERLAVNTPIQGSAADIMKLATVNLAGILRSGGLDSNLILHVHDEIVLELKEKDIDELCSIVIDSMENCVRLKASLKVDIKTGKNWYI